jgi:hypothetical protein
MNERQPGSLAVKHLAAAAAWVDAALLCRCGTEELPSSREFHIWGKARANLLDVHIGINQIFGNKISTGWSIKTIPDWLSKSGSFSLNK